jgi:hypothetical protein
VWHCVLGKSFHGSERWKRTSGDGVDERSRLSGTGWIAGPSRGRRVGEPDFVALFNMQVPFQGVGERGVTVIEIAEVRAVDRGARKDTGRNRREHVTRIRKRVGIRWMQGDDLIAAGRFRHDSEGATDLI